MCLAFGITAAQAQVNQPYDGSGNVFASQNDTAVGGFGNFATTYDDFTFNSTTTTTGISWVGGYFNGSQAPISSFDITFYLDNGGVPGSAIAAGNFGGNANETVISDPIYSYSVAWNPFTFSAGTYFVSIVAEIPFPPQWGWATSAVGNNGGYQDFFGTGSATGVNNAFSIQTTPEPASMAAIGMGLVAILRRRAKKA